MAGFESDCVSDPDPNQAERAKATLSRVKTGLDAGQAPALSQVVQIIRDISARADRMSVADLAECIDRDPSTMARILSIASTLGYNPTGAEIISIHHAIALIGFERIRNLAVSVLMMENAEQLYGAEANKELGALSLVSGLFAEELAQRGLEVDRDLVFVCAALRNYGRMLMATFMAEDYAAAVESAAFGKKDESFKATFGLTPLELARELLESQQLPDVILNSLQSIPPRVREAATLPPSAELAVISELGHRLAELINQPTFNTRNGAESMAALTREYGNHLLLSPEGAKSLVAYVAGRVDSFSQMGKFPRTGNRYFARLECLRDGRPLPPPYQAKPRVVVPPQAVPAADSPAQPGAAVGSGGSGKRSMDGLSRDLAGWVTAEQPDLPRIFSHVVQTLHEALALESCVLFLSGGDLSSFHADYGQGSLLDLARAHARIARGQRDVFSVCIARGEDLIMQNPADERTKAVVPEWLRSSGPARPVFILPFKGDRGVFGLFCGSASSGASLALFDRVLPSLQRLRAQLALIAGRVR